MYRQRDCDDLTPLSRIGRERRDAGHRRRKPLAPSRCGGRCGRFQAGPWRHLREAASIAGARAGPCRREQSGQSTGGQVAGLKPGESEGRSSLRFDFRDYWRCHLAVGSRVSARTEAVCSPMPGYARQSAGVPRRTKLAGLPVSDRSRALLERFRSHGSAPGPSPARNHESAHTVCRRLRAVPASGSSAWRR